MPINAIHVAIVDDHVLYRKTLKSYLSEQQNIRVSVQTSSITELLELLRKFPVDVLLMDIYPRETEMVEAVLNVRKSYPGIRILVVAEIADLNFLSDLIDIGIHGYISAEEQPEDLLEAIHAVAENRLCRSRRFAEALYRSKVRAVKPCAAGLHATLTERDKLFLRLLWEEKSNKEIAEELFLGVRTIERIRQEIKEKIGVRTTAGMIKFAIRNNILHTPPLIAIS